MIEVGGGWVHVPDAVTDTAWWEWRGIDSIVLSAPDVTVVPSGPISIRITPGPAGDCLGVVLTENEAVLLAEKLGEARRIARGGSVSEVHGHERVECSRCGATVRQCRCIGPKPTFYVDGCASCPTASGRR